MERTGSEDKNVTRATKNSTSANGLFTSPSIVQVQDLNFTEGSSVDVQVDGGKRLEQQVGNWMSSMFVASLDMHQRMCVAGQVQNKSARILYLAIIL